MEEQCEICLHPITDPVCVSCYLKHARVWLRDFGVTEKQVEKAIAQIKESLPAETLNQHRCVICGKNDVSVCMYCSFLRTSKVLLRLAKSSRTPYEESHRFTYD